MQESSATKPSINAWLTLIFLAAIWGTSFILMKKSLVLYSSVQVGALRIVAAFLFFLPILINNLKAYPKASWFYLALSGFLGVFFPAFLFTFAGKHLPSAISGALNSLTPLCTLIIGALFFNSTVKRLQIFGIVLGIIGSLFLIFSGNIEHLSFNIWGLLVLAATVMYGFNLNIVKKHLNGIPSLLVTAGLLSVIGPIAVFMLLSTDFVSVTVNNSSLLPLTYAIILGIVGTGLATVLFNKLLQQSTAVFASQVTYLIPIFAFLWGVIDGETIGIQHLVGMAIILVGVYLVNKA